MDFAWVVKQVGQMCKPAAVDSDWKNIPRLKQIRWLKLNKTKTNEGKRVLLQQSEEWMSLCSMLHSWHRLCGTQHRTGSEAQNIVLSYHTPIVCLCKHIHSITRQKFASYCATQKSAAHKITANHAVHHQHCLTILKPEVLRKLHQMSHNKTPQIRINKEKCSMD